MPINEHLVLCGATAPPGRAGAAYLNLNLDGPSANVHLKIKDISRRLLANISDVHADLLEIASYTTQRTARSRAEVRPTRKWECGGGESFGS
jgi:hypothetical protein